MLGDHHDLAHEFPEFRARIHLLKVSNKHFARLFEEYESLDKEIYRIEEQIETTSDEYLEGLKRKRLQHKDALYQMLRESRE